MVTTKRDTSRAPRKSELFHRLKLIGLFSFFVALTFSSSASGNSQKTLDELVKLELERVKSDSSVSDDQKSINSRTIDQFIEEELARENAEPSDFKDKKNLKSGTVEGGATYTRWGRTTCPYGSEIVYLGVAGGSHYSQHGGGSNYLCLPLTPEWGYYTSSSSYGKVYGAEMESPVGFDLSNNGGNSLHNSNALCVVCRSLQRSSTIMIPARRTCYSGWHREYEGYLMTEHYGHYAQRDFICVDKSPEALLGGYQNEGGAQLFNVEGHCGSLPCPPYVEGRELACVVCSK